MRRTLGVSALLAASLVISVGPNGRATAADDGCRIRWAEQTICPSFQVLESQSPLAVSGDGRTVGGGIPSGAGPFPADPLPVLWVDGVARPLEGLPKGLRGTVSAISRDGTWIAGPGWRRDVDPSFVTFRWRDGATELLDAYEGSLRTPEAVSGDGAVLVTVSDVTGARWTEASGVFEAWDVGLPGFLEGAPTDVSGDGRVVVGFAFGGPGVLPFEWVGDATAPLPTPLVSGRPISGLADGVSPDGSVAVGTALRGLLFASIPEDCGPQQPCGAVWRDGVFSQRDFPVRAASWEGAFLLENRPGAAALADTRSGSARTLDEILDALGVERAASAYWGEDLSYDGHVVVGRAGPSSSDGHFRAVVSPKLGVDIEPWRWRNRVDLWRGRPVVVRIYGSEHADAGEIQVDALRFGPERAPALAAGRMRDWNRDGHLDRDFRFDPRAAGLAFGDTEACVSGSAADLPFRLCSRIETWSLSGWFRAQARR